MQRGHNCGRVATLPYLLLKLPMATEFNPYSQRSSLKSGMHTFGRPPPNAMTWPGTLCVVFLLLVP